MRYYLIAGEASGDLHGSNLIKALSEVDQEAAFRCWGGERMRQAGAELVKHYRETAYMGFWEVVRNLKSIYANLHYCRKDIINYKPDVVILIDYPGFNLRIAEFLSKKSIKTFYYISPQVWAWHRSRVKKIKKIVDRMFVILPFEEQFYEEYGYKVDFVGHPLLDAIANRTGENKLRKRYGLSDKPIIALLPGSRKQEVEQMLPVMLSVCDDFRDYQFIVAGVSNLEKSFYERYIKNADAKLITDSTYDLLEEAYAAFVTSGTATLETALFGVPEVVCYKGGFISYQIGRRLVNVKYISLVNLIMDKEVVKELIQDELTSANLKQELKKLLDEERRKQMMTDFEELRKKLGEEGASKRAASLMYNYLTQKIEAHRTS